MPRKAAPKPLQRNAILTARVTDREKAIVQETAERLGKTVNALIYELIMQEAGEVGVFAGSRSGVGPKT